MNVNRNMKTLTERFWEKVNKETVTGCWEWTSSKHGNGYGWFATHHGGDGKRKAHKAHRLSWQLINGEIPDGLCVLHKCDNKICVNPDHLFLGTKSDNMKDCSAKGRLKLPDLPLKTHCSHGHEFVPENFRIDKHGHRVCKECERRRRREKQEKKCAEAIRAGGKDEPPR